MEEQRRKTPATIEEIRRDRQWQVAKSNQFIQKTRFNMDLMQQKIILHIISKIKPKDTELQKTYTFNYYDFCRLCGKPMPKGGKDFVEFKESLLDLRRMASEIAYIDAKGHERFTSIGWVTYYDFNTKTGEVQIELDRNLAPFLLELKGLYTTYPLLFILPMKSKYSVRLYEFLKSYSNLGYCEIELNELRRLLQNKYVFDEEKGTTRELKESEIKLEYTQFSDFNRFVLKRATEEINKNTDIFVEYKVNRVKRVPVSITFFFHDKEKEEIDAKIREINEFLDNASYETGEPQHKKERKKDAEASKMADILHTTKLEYADGSSKPVLKKHLYARLGEEFTEGYSKYKLETLEKIINYYCTLGNRHSKNDKRIDGGNVFYIDLLNEAITGDHFRELCDYQVLKYTSEKMEEVFDKVIDRDKYLKACIENDLTGWKNFIKDIKEKEDQYVEHKEISQEDDLILQSMTKVPKFENRK